MATRKKIDRLGVILIASGASGTGKSTICRRVRENMPGIGFSVSCTTRPPRSGETAGKDYYFITEDEFKQRVAAGEFIEYAEVFGNYYGTLRSEVINKAQAGEDILLDIDVQGAMQIRAAAEQDNLLAKCCQFVFIAPPSLAILEQRLRTRASDSEEQILKRLKTARDEISFWRKYDYLIINDNLEQAVADTEALIKTMRLDSKRLLKGVENV